MAYSISYIGKFKKDFKKYKNKPKELNLFNEFIKILPINGGLGLPKHMKAHKLSGNYQGFWECHLSPDFLIIWSQEDASNEIFLIRLGSHSDLF